MKSFSRCLDRCALASVALVIFTLSASPEAFACDAHAVPVAVQVEFDIEALKARRQQLEADVQQALVGHIRKIFPFWCFETSEREDGVRLVFRLHEDRLHGEGLMQAKLVGSRLLGDHHLGVFYRPNDGGAIGRLRKRPRLFEEVVRNKLRNEKAHEVGVFELLKDGVPLATSGQWHKRSRGMPSVVLPLPWEPTFQELQFSRFSFRGERPGYGTKWFEEASGSPDPALYPVEPIRREESFEALQVFPARDSGPSQPTSYEPRDVKLEEHIPWMRSMMRKGKVPETLPGNPPGGAASGEGGP